MLDDKILWLFMVIICSVIWGAVIMASGALGSINWKDRPTRLTLGGVALLGLGAALLLLVS